VGHEHRGRARQPAAAARVTPARSVREHEAQGKEVSGMGTLELLIIILVVVILVVLLARVV
jgi:hypothetical protein